MNTRKNVLLGAFLVVGLALLTLFSLYLTDQWFGARQEWVAYFGEESIVREGFEVWSGGIKIGVIDKITAVPDAEFTRDRQVVAKVLIREGITIWRNGELVIRAAGFLGGFRADLLRGTPDAGVRPNAEPLPARIEAGIAGQLRAIVRENRDGVSEITRNLSDMIRAINRGEGTLGGFVRDEKLYRDLTVAARNIADFTEKLNRTDSSLGLLLKNDSLHKELTRGIRSIANIADKIDRGEGTLGGLLNDKALLTQLTEGVRKISELATDVQSGQGALGVLLKDPDTADNVAKTIKAVRIFVEALNDGDGAIPSLLHKPEIYNDIRDVTAKLKSITEKIHSGEGTLGKFLTNDGIYNELQRMLESFRESGDIARENAAMGSLTSFASLFFNTFN